MPTPAGYADCSYQLTLSGFVRPSYVTFGVDPSDTDPAAVATALLNAWQAAGSLNTIMDSQVTMTQVRVSMGTDAGGGDLVYVLPTSVVGGKTGSSLPPNCALLLKKTTARGGRRGRGRMYLPWAVDESLVDETGAIPAPTVSAASVAAGVWRIALNSNGCPLVILHASGKTATGAPDPVISMSADRLIATQRRRLGR